LPPSPGCSAERDRLTATSFAGRTGGVDPTQVAEWAGNSVPVLLRTYAKCIHGREEINRKRIEDALRDEDEDGR
jgi:hypothetical protein